MAQLAAAGALGLGCPGLGWRGISWLGDSLLGLPAVLGLPLIIS